MSVISSSIFFSSNLSSTSTLTSLTAILKVFYKYEKKHPDTNNITKSIFDGVEKSGIILNDSQITKIFIDAVPNKYIPIQNVVVGIISALICYFTGIETNLLQSIVLCLAATMGAGGIADLINIKNK